jgi:hypothetical protein
MHPTVNVQPEPTTLVQIPSLSDHTRSLADSPFRGTIFINEVASTPTPNFCSSNDWIEFINTGNVFVDFTGFKLHDDRGPSNGEALIFPYGNYLYPKQIDSICRPAFKFDIDSNDTITLLDSNGDLISTTGVIPNGGNATSTYQRTTNNTYMYGRPSPDQENFRVFNSSIFINEVASSPTNNGPCSGNDWIELFNPGNSTVDLSGLILHDDRGPTDNESFTIPPFSYFIYSQDFSIICGQPSNLTFPYPYYFRFDIDGNDTITLLDYYENVISTTGVLPIGGNATSTYQRTTNNTYMYGRPTPRRKNFPIFNSSIFINEVASTPTIDYYCNGNDWIELFNAENYTVDLTGLILHDDKGPTDIKSFAFEYLYLYPGQLYVLCGGYSYQSSYYFGFNIDGNDTITLIDYNGNVISTTGVLPNRGSAASTYQRTSNNTYKYAFPTPYRDNFPVFSGSIYINEVASTPTPNFGNCYNGDWIELINAGNITVDLRGLVLHDDRGPTNDESFTIGYYSYLEPGEFAIICGQTSYNFSPVSSPVNSPLRSPVNSPVNSPTSFIAFSFNIDSNDTITLRDYNGNVLSTTGVLTNGGNATSTYQRTKNNTYMYGSPTPDKENFVQYPINDDCDDATVVDPLSGKFINGDTTYALTDYIFAQSCGSTYGVSRGIWYKVTNPGQTTLTLTATTCYEETNFDTRISVYKGTDCFNLQCVDSNDDSCDSSSKVKFAAAAFSTYYIFVYGFADFGGSFGLTIGTTLRVPVPVPVPVKLPVPVPVPVSVSIPTGTAPSPVTTPTAIAPTPTIGNIPNAIPSPNKVPSSNQVPTKAPTKSPTKSPIRSNDNCGIFGLNFFCLGRDECGFWRRLLNLRGC